jgi:nicotinamidase-related amidase
MKLNVQRLLQELRPYRERKAAIDPKHTAFLAIDLQNYFDPIVQPVLSNILEVIQSCRKKNIPIIFTQHGHKDPAVDGGLLRKWRKPFVR